MTDEERRDELPEEAQQNNPELRPPENTDGFSVTENKTQSTEQGEQLSIDGLLSSDKPRDRKYLTESEYYQLKKEEEMKKLAEEFERKNSHDTKKKRRNWWIKTILMLVFIGISVYIMFTINQYVSSEGTKSFSEMIRGIHWGFFVVFIAVALLYMLLEGMKYSYLLKISTGKFRLKTSLKTMYLGKYYDAITPLATGGQPFQILYLHKKDIPAGVATSVPLVRFIVTTIVFCLISVVLLAIAPILVPAKSNLTSITYIVAWISLGLNLLVPVVIVFVSLFPKAGRRMIAGIVSLFSRIKIVKHKYPTMRKYIVEIDEYRNALKVLIKRWWKLIPMILICIAESVVYLSIPFFSTLAIAGPNVTGNLWELFLQTICLAIVSFYFVSWIPTPGNSGVQEASSTLVFSAIAGIGSVIGWMVLLWRFATFYVYLLSGIGITVYEIIRDAVRSKRAQKRQKQNGAPENTKTKDR